MDVALGGLWLLGMLTFIFAVGVAAGVGAFVGAAAGLWFGGRLLLPALQKFVKGLDQL